MPAWTHSIAWASLTHCHKIEKFSNYYVFVETNRLLPKTDWMLNKSQRGPHAVGLSPHPGC